LAEPRRATELPAAQFPAQELSAGADITAHSWAAYTSLTASFASDIRDNGWRFRMGGGYGRYSYSSRQWNGVAAVTTPYDGTITFADVLAGYQHRSGPLTVKVFAGAAAQNQSVTPFDIESPVLGWNWGAKGALETWLDIGDRAYLQIDIAYATPNDSYSGRLRLGHTVMPMLSAGLEAGVAGDAAYDAGRIGAFVRYETGLGEMSFSAGAAGDRSEISGVYGTLNALYRF